MVTLAAETRKLDETLAADPAVKGAIRASTASAAPRSCSGR